MIMNWIQFLKRGGINVLKGIAVALASVVGLVIGGIITSALNMPIPVLPANVNLAALLPLMFLSKILIAIVLGECFQRLYPKFWQRLVLLWLCNYLLYYLLNTLDALFFTTMTNLGTGIVSNLFPALFASATITVLWKPRPGNLSERRNMLDYFSTRKPGDWAWRFVLAWLIFPPIYYLAGRVVALFTLRYYTDPSLNTGLTLNNFTIESLMTMQVLRGALFLVAVLPIIIAYRGTRTTLWLWLGSVIFIQIAIQTILQAYWLPLLAVRIPHGIELLVDSFAQAYLYALFLYAPPSAVPELNAERRSNTSMGRSGRNQHAGHI
jgi:hypothetical protein